MTPQAATKSKKPVSPPNTAPPVMMGKKKPKETPRKAPLSADRSKFHWRKCVVCIRLSSYLLKQFKLCVRRVWLVAPPKACEMDQS
jgi:hypothetical protein